MKLFLYMDERKYTILPQWLDQYIVALKIYRKIVMKMKRFDVCGSVIIYWRNNKRGNL